VNVRLHHERIAAHRLDGFRLQLMPGPHDQAADLLQGLGPESNQIVLDAPPIEIGFLALPITDAHDLPQLPMVLGQVLELVVIQVAAQPRRRQDRDFPVVHAAPAALAVAGPVDILAHQLQKLPP
jgi:hypothetical protein